MQALADSPDSWEIVEMKKNGAYSVLEQVVSTTRAAGKIIGTHFHYKPATALPTAA
jgi:hypothetical protein